MALYDVSDFNDSVTVEGAIITNDPTAIATGTGVYDAFLSMQASPEEEAFNTDDGTVLDGNHDNFTHSVLLSTIPTVTIDGVVYLEFRSDLNESDKDDEDLILLQQLKIFQAGSPTLNESDWTGEDFGDAATLKYTLGDNQVLLSDEWNAGSGKGDYIFRIPASNFDFTSPDQYIVVYMKMGTADGDDPESTGATFEEFGVLKVAEAPPSIHIEKDANPVTIGEGTSAEVTYTYTLTNTSPAGAADPLVLTSLVDDSGTPGVPGDDVNLLEGFVQGVDYGDHYVSGDDGDFLLEANEAWVFDDTRTVDAGAIGSTVHNVAVVRAHDNENVNVSDDDDATVTVVDAPPVINIVKTGPGTINEGGDTATYTFTITNDSNAFDPVTVTSLVDDKFGDLLADFLAANGGSAVINPGDSVSFEFTSDVIVLNAGDTHTNIVTVVGHDDEGTQDTDSDDEDVTVVGVAPLIEIVKGGPTVINEGGDTATYTFLVTNNSVETDPLTITSVIDDKLGDLTAAAIAGNGGSAILLPGESFSFEFTSDIIVLDAGGTQTNIVTVVGVDDEGETATDDDNHIVTAENVAPLISIVKDGPAFINEGGEDVTFHITITNNSVETDPLTITSLEDDVFGNILAAAEEANGGVITLAAGDSFDFFFNPPGEIDLNAFETHTDVVTVVGTDDEGDTATAHDDHIITARDVLPVITIDKTGVLEVDEGGADVVFTFVITNTSTVDAVTLTSIDDDKLLSLLAIAEAKNGGPITLQPGESIDFEAPAFLVLLNAGGTFDNTVTVIGQDDDGNTADAVDTHTITARGIPGDIALVKTVDADGDGVFHDSEMVQAFGDSVTYKYEVTNASLFPLVDPLTIDDLTDDQGQFAGFDLMLNGALQAGVTLVKTGGDQDALLEKDETWTFTKTVNVNLNPGDNLINTATVTGADDEGSPVSDTDTAEVLAAVVGPGVRTPGFWGNLGLDFWDGDASIPKTGPNFPGHDLLYAVDSNNDGVINNLDEKGLLIGDYGLDGAAPDGLSTGQDTFFISLDDAHKIIDASQKESQDTRWVLARDEIATWLNYLAGNPIGDATDPNSPHTYLDEGIDWLQATSTNGSAADTFDSWSEGGAKVPASSPIWQQAIAGNVDSASEIHTQLDSYNNTGSTFDIVDVNGVPTKVFHMYASDAG